MIVSAGGMRAHATLATERVTGADGHPGSRVTSLRGQAPLLPRLVQPSRPEPCTGPASDVVQVCVAAGAAGPIGGDDYQLDIDAGAHSTLVLTEVSATLLLPGPCGAQSRMATIVRLRESATLIWLQQPVIAAKDCHHVSEIYVEMAVDARVLVREQLVLGRYDEPPGRLFQRVRVERDHRPLYHQELAIGGRVSGWDGPAVAHHYRAMGSVLVVDPHWVNAGSTTTPLSATAARLRLNGPAAVLSAVADDAVAFDRALDAALATIGPPWCPI